VERTPWGKRLLRARFWIYALVVIVLLVFRVVPSLRSVPGARKAPFGEKELRISGLDNAPLLIPRLVAFYHQQYSDLRMETMPGGTIRAVEDLLNGRADVAFVSRPLTAPEDSVVRSVGDSLLLFPVALSGTLVLTARSTNLDELSVGGLRKVLLGQRPAEWPGTESAPVYAPSPSSGFWGAVASQLGLADTVGANVEWTESDREAARMAESHPGSIALISSLAFDPSTEPGLRPVQVAADPGTAAATPTPDAIAGGTYPLYHYLYASCRNRPRALAAGFVSFLHGEKGQMLVRREGFLPAREIAREIELGQMPAGMPR